jgi:hypothetical protein
MTLIVSHATLVLWLLWDIVGGPDDLPGSRPRVQLHDLHFSLLKKTLLEAPELAARSDQILEPRWGMNSASISNAGVVALSTAEVCCCLFRSADGNFMLLAYIPFLPWLLIY